MTQYSKKIVLGNPSEWIMRIVVHLEFKILKEISLDGISSHTVLPNEISSNDYDLAISLNIDEEYLSAQVRSPRFLG